MNESNLKTSEKKIDTFYENFMQAKMKKLLHQYEINNTRKKRKVFEERIVTSSSPANIK
jgi:hypothetical protein